MSAPIAFALQFRGDAVEVGDGRMWAESRAPTCFFVNVFGRDGLRGRLGGDGVVCRRELELSEDGSLAEAGEITFDAQSSITFRSRGELAGGRGTAMCEVTGGRGALAGAHGYIATNLELSDSGELTDDHIGLLFVERPD